MKNILNKVNADRTFFDSLGNYYPVDRTVDITKESIDGVTCHWFVPDNFEDNKIIIYLHGGMFGLGSIQSHKPMVSRLSTRILFVDYALAPENPFPNGLNDVVKVYREIIRNYPDAKIYVMGDSAGGGLSVTMVNKIIENQLPMPTGIILISPWIYLKCDTDSYETRKGMDQILKKEKLTEYANYYVGDNWNEADPGNLTFRSFPPLLILVGSNEILIDDSKLFYAKIKLVQSNTQMKEYNNKSHVWLITDKESEESKNAMAEIKHFFAEISHP